MSFVFADGTIRTLAVGTIVTVKESVLYTVGTSTFPYTPDNRWVFISTGNYDKHPLVLAPTKETLNSLSRDNNSLHSGLPSDDSVLLAISGNTISAADNRFYFVHSKDVIPTDEVVAINSDTLGVVPHYCYYCGNNTCGNNDRIDDRYICDDCRPSHTFVCSECGEVHDTRRRMKGSLNICRVCFDNNRTKYARAQDQCVYRIEDLVIVESYGEATFVTQEYADSHTFLCAECGSRHYYNDGVKLYGRYYCIPCADIKYPLCNHCHRRHAAVNTFDIEDRKVCKRCRDSYYGICDYCGEYHRLSEMRITEDTHKRACASCQSNLYRCNVCGKFREEPYTKYDFVGYYGGRQRGYLCDACVRNFVPCADCGVLVHSSRRNSTFPDGKKYCSSCAENHFFHCANCGKWITVTDTSSYHGDGENRICHECYTEMDHGLHYLMDGSNTVWMPPRGINNYEYKPDGIVYPGKDERGIYYGIELETDRYNDSTEGSGKIADKINNILGFTYAKHDGSLGWDGIEFVSHPATMQYYMDNKNKFAKAMAYLRNHGYQSHSGGNCGLHVHVSSFPILYDTDNGVEKLLYMWDKFWNPIVKCSRRGLSDGGRWASRIRCDVSNVDGGTKNEIESLKKTKKDSKNAGRYQAINLQNSHTIEFRLMRGTLNINTFIGSLQLISSIVDIVMAKTYEEIKEMTWDDVLAFHDYAELKALWESHKDFNTRDCGSLMSDNDNFVIGDTDLAAAV